MRRVRTSRTSEERKVERVLRELGIRFRRNDPNLPGKPDFFLVDYSVAVFVDGCFWHGCPRCFSGTQTNQAWWDNKINENRRRDRRIDARLRRSGFRVVHFWKHDKPIRVEKRLLTLLSR